MQKRKKISQILKEDKEEEYVFPLIMNRHNEKALREMLKDHAEKHIKKTDRTTLLRATKHWRINNGK